MPDFWKALPKPFSVLAPMEDVTDTVFRQIVMACGRPDVFFTEFTSADGLASVGRDKVKHRLEFLPNERPLVAQIWGNRPENYYKAAKEIAALGFDGLDINMGCPVSKVIGKGCCSALIENQSLARELIIAAREGAGEIPVSVKTRLGYRDLKTVAWTEFLLEQNLSAITVHGRIARQLSKYPANWEEIRKVCDLRNQSGKTTAIIGNGDVQSFSEIRARHAQYGVDGVMVGRGIFHNLFIFNPSGPESMSAVPCSQKIALLEKHLQLNHQRRASMHYGAMKKFFKIYLNSFEHAADLRQRLMTTDNPAAALEILRDTHLLSEDSNQATGSVIF